MANDEMVKEGYKLQPHQGVYPMQNVNVWRNMPGAHIQYTSKQVQRIPLSGMHLNEA